MTSRRGDPPRHSIGEGTGGIEFLVGEQPAYLFLVYCELIFR